MGRFLHSLVLLGLMLLLVLNVSVPPAIADVDDEIEENEVEDEMEEELEEYDEDDGDIDAMSINGQKISFGIPEDGDDFHSMHIPDNLKCDACKILANQYKTAFDKANKKRPSLKKQLAESSIIDILEEVCESEFLDVGVKEVKGVKRLSGPGMSIAESPGIMQGGGKWPYRMQSLCSDIVGQVGEEDIYELYLKDGLEARMCLVNYPSCVTTMKNGHKRVEL